ncbi:hypothetical protein CDAR_409241 [Caerostris darwini]|uniref:Uncharacterized protein n=1 Tax=Caerostris darwini TaxID=1538125 RepID=A0AAV4UDL3_9ARAC|nr:hypothetical protein CDAR_409241 [Caerostris darwini]
MNGDLVVVVTYTPTIPDSSSLQTSSSESSEELPSPPEFDSSRTVTTTELPCGPSCAKAGRHKIKQNSPRKKPDPIGYKEPKPIPRNKIIPQVNSLKGKDPNTPDNMILQGKQTTVLYPYQVLMLARQHHEMHRDELASEIKMN